MMVPTDGKFFFANDVMRSAFGGSNAVPQDDPDGAPSNGRAEPGTQAKPNGRP
jgi:hypothetical protein